MSTCLNPPVLCSSSSQQPRLEMGAKQLRGALLALWAIAPGQQALLLSKASSAVASSPSSPSQSPSPPLSLPSSGRDGALDPDLPVDVYFINLARRPDRAAHMRSEFAAHRVGPPSFRVHRLEAFDGAVQELSRDEAALFEAFDAAGFAAGPNAAALKGNALSHLGAWRALLDSGAQAAVVLQDDVELATGFAANLREVVRFNPREALVTWLGLNAFANGPVSRSAVLEQGGYDPDFFSAELPGTRGALGVARRNLVATGSLAYLVTRRGAEALCGHFGDRRTGWGAHTDHALVSYLDSKGLSFISRRLLATTHDHGALGSDIFSHGRLEAAALARVGRLVRLAIQADHLNTAAAARALERQASEARGEARGEERGGEAVADGTNGGGKADGSVAGGAATPSAAGDVAIGEEEAGPSTGDLTTGLMAGLRVSVEEAACLDRSCFMQPQTTVFLSWAAAVSAGASTVRTDTSAVISTDSVAEATTEANAGATTSAAGAASLSGARRSSFLIQRAAAEVTAADVLAALPAAWVLVAWSAGRRHVPAAPRPRFRPGDRVQCAFRNQGRGPRSSGGGAEPQQAAAAASTLSLSPPLFAGSTVWEAAVVAAVGYWSPAWGPDTVAAYVVEVADGRLLTVERDDPSVIREGTSLANEHVSPTATTAGKEPEEEQKKEQLERQQGHPAQKDGRSDSRQPPPLWL